MAIVLVLLGLLVAGGAWLLAPEDAWHDLGPGMASTYVQTREGLAVYYRLLERLGFEVERNHTPLLADALENMDVVVMTGTGVTGLKKGEARDVRQWVRQGGLLVASAEVAEQMEIGQVRSRVDFSWMSYDEEAYELLDVAPGPAGGVLSRGVRRLYMRPRAPRDAPEGRVLLAAEGKAVIEQIPRGDGHVIVLYDVSMLANTRIDRGDNAIAAANLAAWLREASRGSRLVFEEYHYHPGQGGWWRVLSTVMARPPGWAIAVLTVAGLLWLLNRGRKFGYRRSRAQRTYQTQAGYARHVGATYRQAGANRLTLSLLLQWLRAKLCRSVGRDVNVTDEELAGALERAASIPARRSMAVLSEAQAALRQSRVSAKTLKRVVDSLAHLEREIADERIRGR
jgi:hypothetical protein